MNIACWIPKVTNTQSEYVKRIDFPLQQSLQDRASMLRYMKLPVLLFHDGQLLAYILFFGYSKHITLLLSEYNSVICENTKGNTEPLNLDI
jgi:hypothetical protein